MPDKDEKLEDYFSDEQIRRLKTLDVTNENFRASLESNEKYNRRKFSLARTPKWLITLVGIAVVMALAFFYVRVVDPWIAQNNANAALANPIEQQSIVAQNDEFIPYLPDAKAAGEIPEGVNPEQLSLGESGVISEPSVFIFSSKNANADSHVLDLYMDFYSQRSRDFITINQTTLENLVKSGKLTIRVHPVLNKEPFSIHAPEALAEAFGTAPDKAWGFFTDLLKESITLTGDETTDEIVTFIANNANDNGVKAIDSASIVNATFLTWLYTTVDDPKLKTGYIPPVIYVDDKELDQDIWSINNPEQMLKYFSALS